jgi:hypothetical protein
MSQALPYSLEQLQNAFGYVESSNRYDAIGPETRRGGNAYGRYQVMDFNVPSWSEQYYGQRLTPQEFLANPQAQDAVFYGRMGEYYSQGQGAPEDRVRNAASLWFTGQPYSAETANRSDGFINNQQYGDRILRALGSAPQGASEMTMDPNPPQQPRGFLGGIFGGQQQPDPNAGSPTDPFANLSRAQRTMLGFAALRDAAASLEGRDSNYFSSALGGFEAARERERLRAQGEMANRVNALQSLAQIEALARATGDPALAEFAAAQRAVLLPPSGGVVTSGVTTGATPPVTPAGGAPGAGVVRPADQVRADLDRALDPETGGVDAAGRPFPAETPEPVVEPLPEAAPTPAVQPDVAVPTEAPAPQSTRISEAQARLDRADAEIEDIISRLPGASDVLVLGMAGLPAGVSPQDQTRLQILFQQREDAATELRDAREAEAYPFEDVQSARREFTSQPEVRSFVQQTFALGRVISSAEEPSPAGDLALIFNYMKILDPGSVVREGEFATAQNAGSVDTRVRSLYNRLLEGERLTPVQREDFVSRAIRIYEGAETQYQSIADQYRANAEAAGLPVEQVIPDFTYAGEIPRSVVPETPEGYSRSEWFDIWQRMTPEEQQAYREAGE